jgi:hypothetical protein
MEFLDNCSGSKKLPKSVGDGLKQCREFSRKIAEKV